MSTLIGAFGENPAAAVNITTAAAAAATDEAATDEAEQNDYTHKCACMHISIMKMVSGVYALRERERGGGRKREREEDRGEGKIEERGRSGGGRETHTGTEREQERAREGEGEGARSSGGERERERRRQRARVIQRNIERNCAPEREILQQKCRRVTGRYREQSDIEAREKRRKRRGAQR